MAKTNIGRVSVVPKDEYSSTENYKRLDVVSSDGSMYISKKDNNIRNPLADKNWWFKAVEKGEVGPQGEKPVNGVDYNTDEEKEEFKNDVINKATEEVEKNIANIETEAIEDYNKNADEKTTEYNTNADNKLKTYNDNTTEKLKEYNDNASSKVEEYNTNANTKTTEFDTNATSKTNDFNSNATTKTNEFNAVVDAEKEEFAGQTEAINHHIAVVSDELERVKNDILETGEESGSYITLNDSAMAEYQELSVDGVCEQETTQGYNILPSKITSKTIYGVEISVNDDKSFVCNGTSEETIVINLLTDISDTSDVSGNLVLPDSDTEFNFSGCTGGGSKTYKLDIWVKSNKSIAENINGNSLIKITDESDREINRVRLVIYKGITLDNVMFKPMIRIASISDNNYEPYTGGQPSPNPEYPQPISVIENSLKITSCNKNLVKLSMGEISPSDGQDKESTTICRTNKYIKIGNNQSIIVSGALNGSPNLRLYDINKNYKGYGAFNSNGIYTNTNLEVAYFRIRYTMGEYTLDQLNNSLMIEYGTQATPFEEHIESVINANIPEGEFIGKINDTYKDTLKLEYHEEDIEYHLMLYKMLKKYTFTGNENIVLNTTSSDYIEFKISNLNLNPSNFLPTVSNYFLYNLNNRIAISNNGIYIRVPVECEIDTVDKFKTFLLSNEVYVYYVLATPYILDLGIVDMPLTYNEITNLFTDSNLMPTINAKYYRNFTKTISDLQVNNKSLLVELTDLESKITTLESKNTDLESRVLALESKDITVESGVE
ncbi:MAG: hypothetical protein ACI4ON_00545 [Clostridia bacterium]